MGEVMGYGSLSPYGHEAGLMHPDTFHFILNARCGTIARVSGSHPGPTVPAQRHSRMSCVSRRTESAGQADDHKLRDPRKIGGRQVNEAFDRRLKPSETAPLDLQEGLVTVALWQATEESTKLGLSVKVSEGLGRFGLQLLLPGTSS